MKKILYIIPNLNKGGAELLLFQICNKLRNEYQLTIITFICKGELSDKFESIGVPVILIPKPNSNFISIIYQLWKIIKIENPFIIHTHLIVADRYGQIAAFLAGVKRRVSTLHNMQEQLSVFEKFSIVILKTLATKIIAVSESTKIFWIKKRNFPKAKIIVIHNCSGFSVQSQSNLETLVNRGNRVIALGNIHPRKDHSTLIRAILLVQKEIPDVLLDIYGAFLSKSHSDLLKSLILDLELSDHIKIKGLTDDSENVLRNHDLLVTPSITEGFGMVNIEAMTLGLPVIASDIPAHKEIIGNDKYGILFEVGNYNQLANQIISIFKSQELYSKLSKQSISRASFFSIHKCIKLYSKFYKIL